LNSPNRNKKNGPNKKPDGSPPQLPNVGRSWLWVALLLLLVFGMQFVLPLFFGETDSVPLRQIISDINMGRVDRIIVHGDTDLEIEYNRNARYDVRYSSKDPQASIYETLQALGVKDESLRDLDIVFEEPGGGWGVLLNLALTILPLLFLGWLMWRMLRSVRAGQDQTFGFGRSNARMIDAERPTVTFEDVAGAEEAKTDLQEVVEFLKEPDKFLRLGARIPKGVLMVGPPGTGKTLMARAIAGEAGVPFFHISGSEFVEMFVGVGASRVRDLFNRAKAAAPAIVFVDEIDAVGRQRGAGLGGGHDEREQTLNQILVEMDGFDNDTNVIVIAATNRPDVLDPALLRSGRFDRKVTLDRPDMREREAILEIHTRGKPLSGDVDLEAIAKITPGFAGADLENLVNEAGILAARRERKNISMSEFQESMERIVAGPERRSRVISPKERRVVAYHESGHALVMHSLPNADPIHKVTIIPRGRGLGYTMGLPETDRYLVARETFLDQMAGILGGRAAEDIVFERITTGASDDLRRATQMARQMVTRYGMSESLGLRAFSDDDGMVFLGRELSERRNYSEKTAQEIDEEIERLLAESYERAKFILRENRDVLEELAQTLLEEETIDGEKFAEIAGPGPHTDDEIEEAAESGVTVAPPNDPGDIHEPPGQED
jgi:cell division protease FtsH